MSGNNKNEDGYRHYLVTDADAILSRQTGSDRSFSFRTLTLDSAVAPLLRQPVVPFEKKKRKQAATAAKYYSECTIQGIPPIAADTASIEAQEVHKKWWIDTKRKRRKTNEEQIDDHPDSIVSLNASERDLASHLETTVSNKSVQTAKDSLIEEIRAMGGVIKSKKALDAIQFLETFYLASGNDCRWKTSSNEATMLDGVWRTLTKPEYSECKGRQRDGSYCYTLGRISFDMFNPTNLECFVQSVDNIISPDNGENRRKPRFIPKKMKAECAEESNLMRNFDIVVSMTVESPSLEKPIPARLTNHGYCLPDPSSPNRLSVWFSGGSLQPASSDDLKAWMELFDTSNAPWRDLKAYARLLAAKILLHASLPDSIGEDGRMTYSLKKPIGGHGDVFVDTIFCDDELRVSRGHCGSLYVFKRENQQT